MKTQLSDQVTILDSQDTHLQTWIEGFFYDRKAQGLSRNTLNYYRKNLAKFAGFCDSLLIKHITELAPHNLRQFLVQLEEQGHNAGGIHGSYRAILLCLFDTGVRASELYAMNQDDLDRVQGASLQVYSIPC